MQIIKDNSEDNSGLKPTVLWGIAEEIPPLVQKILMSLSILLPLVVWWLVSSLIIVDNLFLPSPLQVIKALSNLNNQGFLLQDTIASFLRVTAGFLLASLLAIPLGIAMGAFATIRSLTEPIIGLLRYMPAPAFIPLLIIYCGIGETSKIALIFIGTIFFNTLMIMDAVKFVPKTLIETTYTLGGNRKQVLFKVLTPYILPNIIDTLRINLAAAWNLVIVSELIAAEIGLGKRIVLAQKFLKTDEIFACLIVLGIIGLIIDLSLQLILRITCKWSLN